MPEDFGEVHPRPRWKKKGTRGRRDGMHADTMPMETSVAVHIDTSVYIPVLSWGNLVWGEGRWEDEGESGSTDRFYLLH